MLHFKWFIGILTFCNSFGECIVCYVLNLQHFIGKNVKLLLKSDLICNLISFKFNIRVILLRCNTIFKLLFVKTQVLLTEKIFFVYVI